MTDTKKPRGNSKSAAAAAYKETFGRTPPGRMSGAAMRTAISRHEIQTARLNANIASMRQPSAPAPAMAPRPVHRTMDMTRMANPVPAASPAAPGPSPVRWAGPSTSALSKAGMALPWLGVGTAAVQGYHRGQDLGESQAKSVARGALNAAPAAFVAGHAPIARGAGAFAEGAFGLANALASQTGITDMVFLDAMFAKGAGVSAAAGLAAKGVEKAARFVGKAAIPAAIGVGAVMGAMKDENRLRGAARGALSALDPTALFMNKGLIQRGFDAAFGEQVRPNTLQLNRENPDSRNYEGQGAIRNRRADAGSPGFDGANRTFSAKQRSGRQQAASNTNDNHLRGFQNPNNLMAALKAQGKQAPVL